MSENPAKNFARAHSDAELTDAQTGELGLMVLAVRHADGELSNSFSSLGGLKSGDAVVLYGLDSGHEALEDITRRREER